MYDPAWREKIRRANHHIGGARRVSERFAHAGRSDVFDNRKHEVKRRTSKMRRSSSIKILLLTLLLVATGIAQRSSRAPRIQSQIREDALRAHIKFLSDDRLEGRGTGARGGELAALYIAEQFEAMGLKGAGPQGSFWQPVSLVGVKADPKTELRVNGSSKSEAFKFADDFVAFTGAQ